MQMLGDNDPALWVSKQQPKNQVNYEFKKSLLNGYA